MGPRRACFTRRAAVEGDAERVRERPQRDGPVRRQRPQTHQAASAAGDRAGRRGGVQAGAGERRVGRHARRRHAPAR